MTLQERNRQVRWLDAEPFLGTILNRQRAVHVPLSPLREFLMRARRELRLPQADLTVALVSDAEMARMNEAFRKKKGPTDVLSFPEACRPKPVRLPASQSRRARGRQYLGDIAIAPAVARRNAKSCGRTLASELKALMLHGVLHLLGYDHETDRGRMHRLERSLRRKLGLS